MKANKVLMIVESTSESMDRAFSNIKKPKAKYKGTTIISFPDYETLGRVITGSRIELLSVIRNKKPKSIQELARFVGRDLKNVYSDLQLLQQFGLIELKRSRAGRATIPIASFKELTWAA